MKSFRDFIFEQIGRKRIVMLGGPGSGKSTYSKFLTKEFMIPHVYTGDMMRDLAQQDTEIGRKVKSALDKGDYVDTQITAEDLDVLGVTGPDDPVYTAKLIKDQLNIKDRVNSEVRDRRELRLKEKISSESSTASSRSYLLTPSHYAYVKISEGCNQSCTFCIIPSMRGKLVSRKVTEIIKEAKNLVSRGVKEIIIISQDTGAYGADSKYQTEFVNGAPVKSNLLGLVKELQKLKIWIRLHYIYPYKNIDSLIPLMEKKGSISDVIPSRQGIVPYIDMPFQHAHPDILEKMKRPGKIEKILTRLSSWRKICPELTIRSTFIVGFPGETEAHFDYLLQFLTEAKLDRVGCFTYSPVVGAKANMLKIIYPTQHSVVSKKFQCCIAPQSQEPKLFLNKVEAYQIKHVYYQT